MGELGESLNSPILPYPGQQLLPGSSSTFFGQKSGLNERYIYDLKLSTGEVMYSGKGGMGFTNESHIYLLHDLMRMPYAKELIHEEFNTNFKEKWGRRKFERLRRKVNAELKNPSRRTIAKLYCLLACSGFRYKFDSYGNFRGEYFPHTLDTSEINIKNLKLVNSDFIIQLGKFGAIDKNLLTKKSLIYLNIPFPSSISLKKQYLEYIDYIASESYDFLLTSRLENRGMVDKQITAWSKNYSSLVISQFKEDSLYASSDIFIYNF